MLEFKHDPKERALNIAEYLNIHLNIDYDNDLVYAMIGEKVIYKHSEGFMVSFLCGLHNRAMKITSLLKAEGIEPCDYKGVIESLSETVQSKANIEFFESYIYPKFKGGLA